MFTGIVESVGKVLSVQEFGTNRVFTLEAPFAEGLKVDQSVCHDGVCLTVTEVLSQQGPGVRYTVTAIEETLQRTRLGSWLAGTEVNLERSLRIGDRLDGHFVQGHVDGVGRVSRVDSVDGSWYFHFAYDPAYARLLVPKGSICINGVSLTLVEAGTDQFSVAIIPYTYQHTTFRRLKSGDVVNLEFDILGKYFARWREPGVIKAEGEN